jgi:hypothetical protein
VVIIHCTVDCPSSSENVNPNFLPCIYSLYMYMQGSIGWSHARWIDKPKEERWKSESKHMVVTMPLDARRPENADRELCPCLLQLHPLLYFTFLFCLIDFVCIFFSPCVPFIGVSRRKNIALWQLNPPQGPLLDDDWIAEWPSLAVSVSGMKKKGKKEKEKEKERSRYW